MPKDYTALPPNQVRRSDRAVEDEGWIIDFLHKAAVASMATVHDGQPFINSNLFVYDPEEHAVYLHTARVGRTRGNVDDDSRVCLSVTEMGRLLPADEALEFSVEYSGVVIFGKGEIVEGETAERGLQLLLDKYFPHLAPERDYRSITQEELKRTSVFRITVESWSGKRKKVEDDFPGAYYFGDTPYPPFPLSLHLRNGAQDGDPS